MNTLIIKSKIWAQTPSYQKTKRYVKAIAYFCCFYLLSVVAKTQLLVESETTVYYLPLALSSMCCLALAFITLLNLEIVIRRRQHE